MIGLAYCWSILPNVSQVGRLGLGLTPFSAMQGQIRNFQVLTSEFLIDTQLEMNLSTLKKWQDWVSAIFAQKQKCRLSFKRGEKEGKVDEIYTRVIISHF